MNIKYFFVVILGIIFCTGFAFAQNPDDTSPRKITSVFKNLDGKNVLKLAYPCDQHKDVSLEIRILDEMTSKNLGYTAPLFFSETVLTEKDVRGRSFADVIFGMKMDDSAETEIFDKDSADPMSIVMSYENMKMRISGRLSPIATRQVSVLCQKENTRTGNKREITLVFPYPCESKVGARPTRNSPRNAEAFLFDISEAEFEKPCKILVWVMSGRNILVKEEMDWPGR